MSLELYGEIEHASRIGLSTSNRRMQLEFEWGRPILARLFDSELAYDGAEPVSPGLFTIRIETATVSNLRASGVGGPLYM